METTYLSYTTCSALNNFILSSKMLFSSWKDSLFKCVCGSMILENDGNLISGKVETHSRDEAAPLADQVKEIRYNLLLYDHRNDSRFWWVEVNQLGNPALYIDRCQILHFLHFVMSCDLSKLVDAFANYNWGCTSMGQITILIGIQALCFF